MCGKATIKTGRYFTTSCALALVFWVACDHQPAERRTAFPGAVKAGERFRHEFDGRFIFALEPTECGWFVAIYEQGRREDLARSTLPFHGPNPTQIDGWHFRNSDNTGPNESGPKNVNAPQEEREFIFSPEVGRSIDGPLWRAQLTMEDIDRVSSFGRGKLTIVDYRLRNLDPGQSACFAWMKFRVELSWND